MFKQQNREQIDGLVALARQAVEAEVRRKPLALPESRSPAQPVFVTIERHGKVIGCRGTLRPRTRSLEEEVVQAARSAAGRDPRYRPLTPGDLTDFLVTVTIVERLEPISRESISRLTPDDGLVLTTTSGKSGIVLPWEGKDPQTRLRWAYQKANVPEGAAGLLQRLIGQRFRG
ncbi:MAG: AMMECR1 domain-containing protein [Armatimonas sp.]